jgi:hypothetical protein
MVESRRPQGHPGVGINRCAVGINQSRSSKIHKTDD